MLQASAALGFVFFCLVFGAVFLTVCVFEPRVFGISSTRSRATTLFALSVVFVSLVWIAVWFVWPSMHGAPSGAGEAGDMFGDLTSWFSGLAFAGLIYTLNLQREELRATRREFEHQMFEGSFFSVEPD